MAISTARLIGLYTGDSYTVPCYRLHLANAIVQRLKPRTADELCQRVLGQHDQLPDALEPLLAAYDAYRERQGR